MVVDDIASRYLSSLPDWHVHEKCMGHIVPGEVHPLEQWIHPNRHTRQQDKIANPLLQVKDLLRTAENLISASGVSALTSMGGRTREESHEKVLVHGISIISRNITTKNPVIFPDSGSVTD